MKKLFILLTVLTITACFNQRSRSIYSVDSSEDTAQITSSGTFLEEVSSLLKNKMEEYSPYVYGEKNNPEVFTKDKFNVIGTNCSGSEDCNITLNVSKTSILRPFFVVDLSSPSASCNLKAYVKSIITIAGEVVPGVSSPQTFTTSSIDTKCLSLNDKGYACDKTGLSNVSILTYNTYPITDNNTNESISFGNQKVVKISFSDKSSLNEICLEELLLPSEHNANISERTITSHVAVAQIELTF